MTPFLSWLNQQAASSAVLSVADLVIALGHLAVLVGLLWLLKHCESVLRQHRVVVWLLSAFLAMGALSSLSSSLDFLYPAAEFRLWTRAAMAGLSIISLVAIWYWLPALLDLPQAGALAAANERLRSEAVMGADRMRERTAVLQQYRTALKESAVTVFTQDRDLRYASISNAAFGREIEQIVGQTDAEVLPPASRDAIIAMKQEALQTGKPADGEVRVEIGQQTRCFDLHIEPLTDTANRIVGLTCAMIDITERIANEDHLRLLMRELTHRSKNLLAVIQAIARQTARHSVSIESFLDQFAARMQALAKSHDLLVQESWYGASLSELVRSQLGHYLDYRASDIIMNGPPILLRPEAAQNLGLALHELATNAAKHGALSMPSGRVTIEWRRLASAEGAGLVLTWTESGGPPVTAPTQRGFGSLVIEQNLARSLNAEVDLKFAPEGLYCEVRIPLEHIFMGGRALREPVEPIGVS